MEALTYGQLPSFTEFAKAFDYCTPCQFDIRCNDSDARHFEAAGIEPYSTVYDVAQLWDLLVVLIETWNSDSEHAEWAGDFASSILATLGFEWV